MISNLFKHPFGVQAFFEHSLVLAYTAPRELLAKRLPPYLELDLLGDDTGFIAAAFVKTRNLRPQGFPSWVGNDFILAGYRIFVRYRDARGRRLRGLYILCSETDRWRMKLLGNIFTNYRYSHVPLHFSINLPTIRISSPTGLLVEASLPSEGQLPELPETSPFESWKEARRYSGPLPFTFSYDSNRSEMVIVQGIRHGWAPQPIEIRTAKIPTLTELGFGAARLANAFLVSHIDYGWRPALVERLPHQTRSGSRNLAARGSQARDDS